MALTTRIVLPAVSALALSVLGAVPPFVGAASSAGEMCQGQPATIVSDGEAVNGTPGDDVVVVHAVNVTGVIEVLTGDGDDLVCLTGQYSTVSAALGDGDDSLLVDDTPTARPITARVDVGVGFDTVVTGRGFDEITSGDDTSIAPDGPDDVTTGPGNDTYVANSRLGAVDLGDGDDRIEIRAGDSGQTVQAGPGDDIVAAVRAAFDQPIPTATLDAGAGRDRIVLVDGFSAAVNLRKQTASIGESMFPVVGFQDGQIQGDSARFIGDGQANLVVLDSCEATVKGGRGDDLVRTIDDDERVVTDQPAIICEGHRITHRWFGNQGDDTMSGNDSGHDQLFGGPGDDVIRTKRTTGGNSAASGGGGDDVLIGGSGNDRMFGGNGNDKLRGGKKNDKLFGGAGRDKTFGGQGRDRCVAEVKRSCEK